MKLLYIALDSLNHSIRICNELVKKGYEITLVAMDEDYYDNENIPIPDKKIKLIQDTLKNIENPETFPYDKVKEKYDMIFGSTMRCAPICSVLKGKMKIPWYNMVLDIPTHLLMRYKARRELWETIYLPSLDYADKILLNTNIAMSEYKRITGNRAKPCDVVTYPTHLPSKFFMEGLGKRGDYVISVGRLVAEKNFIIIPIALSMIKGINKYVAIGPDKGQLQKIKDMCKQYGVEFEHYTNVSGEKKMELISKSAMMIYPQHTEYIGGLPPYEGMFCGKPVICSMYKILIDLYGPNALYFTPGEVLELAKNISFVMSCKDELYERLGQNAAEFAEIEAGYEKFADGLHNFLENKKEEEK